MNDFRPMLKDLAPEMMSRPMLRKLQPKRRCMRMTADAEKADARVEVDGHTINMSDLRPMLRKLTPDMRSRPMLRKLTAEFRLMVIKESRTILGRC